MATKKSATKRGSKVVDPSAKESIETSTSPTVSGDALIGFDYILPPDVPVHYVDNVNIIHTPSEFTISFMQSQPPLLKSGAEWNEVKTIPSICVVRLIISPMKMEMVVKALVGNFERYIKTYLQEDTGDASDNTKANGDTITS